MTIHTYGPTVLPVLPRTASDVRVTCKDGSAPTFTTPVTVNPTTHAVSFAVDDHGAPPVELVIRVQAGPGGSSTTLRLTLPPDAPPPPTGGGIAVETDPVAGPAVTAERTRAQDAEAAETTRAEAAEAAKAGAAALTSETSRAVAAEQASQTAASNEAARAQSAESSEATRAQAAEAANTTSINGHVNSTTAHPGSAITFDDTGLIIVKGANVKAALTAIDAWANARPTHEAGLLTALPANGARPNGSTWLATDQYGGTTYRMVSGAWVQEAAGVTQASGQVIAGPVQWASTFDLKAVGATVTDLPGMSLDVPASARPVFLRAKFELIAVTGTAAVAASARALLTITDTANGAKDMAAFTVTQVTAASVSVWGQVELEFYLPAPVAAATYKIRGQLAAAAPANWTSFQVQNSYGQGLGVPRDNFYAVAG